MKLCIVSNCIWQSIIPAALTDLKMLRCNVHYYAPAPNRRGH